MKAFLLATTRPNQHARAPQCAEITQNTLRERKSSGKLYPPTTQLDPNAELNSLRIRTLMKKSNRSTDARCSSRTINKTRESFAIFAGVKFDRSKTKK